MNWISITLLLIVLILLLIIWVKNQEVKDFASERDELIKHKNAEIDKIKYLEAETLKFQLQPHTLRNLFAQMQAVTNKLNRGWDALSVSMEYIFYKGKDHFVTIEEEINFVDNYLKLNGVFIHEFDAVKLNTENVLESIKSDINKQVPHLITAYLLENAFKHGDKNHSHFLRVTIIANNEHFKIEVINKIKKSIATAGRKGIGLENMKKRLEMFLPNLYEIKNSCSEEEYHASLTIFFNEK